MRPRWGVCLALLAVLSLTIAPRLVLHDRTPASEAAGWTVADPDSLYHARRVERVLEEGLPVAGEDPFLNAPHGARIPWPPYYDLLAAAVLAPFAPGDHQARHSFVERGVAWLPFFFGVAASLIAFLAARSLAGTAAGLAAGSLHALSLGSVVYSRVGNGDHHAFVSLACLLVAWGSSWILTGERMGESRRSWALGALLGALVGLALGSWVATLLFVVALDATFAWLLLAHARRRRAGLGAFGLAFHVAAGVVLLPAVLQSPWKAEFPWMVVNLSWFHLAYLGCGALIFLPLVLDVLGERGRRRYPWVVGGLLACVGVTSAALDAGPVPGILEGFEWVSRQDSFMSGVAESRPLLGEGSVAGELFAYLGWQITLLPLAWIAALLLLLREGRDELLPWVIVTPLLALQAAGQARFADALAGPAAVLLGWAGALAVRRLWSRAPAAVPALLLLVLALLGQFQLLQRMTQEGSRARPDWRRERASRELCEWIAQHREVPVAAGHGGAVLANWNRGHEIEWAARAPSVATNFGSYVGEEGFLAPAHFFLADDPLAAEAILVDRDARYVMHSCFLSSALPGWVRAGGEEWQGRYVELGRASQGKLLRPWFETIGARLLNGGRSRNGEGWSSLDFLRLVHVSPTIIRRPPGGAAPSPYGWVWERVPGARLELRGRAGELAQVELQIEYRAPTGELLQTLRFRLNARADEQGVAQFRVPYATNVANGDGVVREASWSMGQRGGVLVIDEEDVRAGARVPVSG